MLDDATKQRLAATSREFTEGKIGVDEWLDRVAPGLWHKGEDGTPMAQQYHTEVGGTSGGKEQGDTPNAALLQPRHLLPVAQNGHAGDAHKLEIRSVTVRLDAPYDGFWARMRLNPRRSTIDMLRSGEIRPVSDAVCRLILAWEFWDEDGAAIDLSPDAVYDLPDDLLAALVTGYFTAFAERSTPDKSDAAGAA